MEYAPIRDTSIPCLDRATGLLLSDHQHVQAYFCLTTGMCSGLLVADRQHIAVGAWLALALTASK